MKIRIFLLLVLSLSAAEARDVYRWVGPDGSVNFSDEPRAGATRITMPEWAPPAPRRVQTPSPGITRQAESVTYARLAILRPEPEQNIHDNEGKVAVGVMLEPALDPAGEHRIQLLLDGQPVGEPKRSLAQMLQGVERGEHKVVAQVLDKDDQVLISSEPVVFYLKDASPLLHPPNPGNTIPPPPASSPPQYFRTGPDQAQRAPMAERAPRADHSPFRPAPPPSGSTPSN